MSLYRNPKYYELAFSFRDIPGEVNFFERAIKRFSNIRVRTVLELASGNSPYLEEWQSRGYAYWGLDLSPAMLRFVKGRARHQRIEVKLLCADMNRFSLKVRKVDLVYVLLGSLFATSNQAFLCHLKCVANALKRGGLYLLDGVVWFNLLSEDLQRWTISKNGVKLKCSYRAVLMDAAKQLFRDELVVKVTDGPKRLRLRSTELHKFFFPQEFLALIQLNNEFEFGIPGHGAALVECENKECRHSLPVAFSCKKRFCPSCAAKRALIFAEHLHSEVLAAVTHWHIVFGIPKRLRPFVKYDRSLNDVFLAAAWRSLSELFGAVLPQGKPGLVLTVQTAGESANFNPHLHGILTAGVFDAQGAFHELEHIDTDKLQKLFCHHVLRALQDKNLITDTVVAQIMGQAHSGFSAWVGEKLTPDDSNYRLFLAGYIDRGPVANSRLAIEDDTVTYHTEKDPLTHEFSALEFLARLTPQVADKWESTVRYYGHYSHRARGARRKAQEKQRHSKKTKTGQGAPL
jgi:hypothetical protein